MLNKFHETHFQSSHSIFSSDLKRVTADMQTHKNTALRSGPAPFKAPTAQSPGTKPVGPAAAKAPVFTRDGKKWLIEHQRSNPNLIVEDAEMNNVVYVFKCENSTITVKGKINSIFLDSCKKCSVLFDAVVSSVEFVNCQSVQMQVSVYRRMLLHSFFKYQRRLKQLKNEFNIKMSEQMMYSSRYLVTFQQYRLTKLMGAKCICPTSRKMWKLLARNHRK